MLDDHLQQIDQEQKPQADPGRSIPRKWNRRAKYGLVLAIASSLMVSGKASLIVSAILIPFEWAWLYGLWSAILLIWRLITGNPSDKPLWNRHATITVCLGLFFAAFAVFQMFSSPTKASAEALSAANLVPMFIVTWALFACVSYGIGTGISRISQRRGAV